MISGRIIPSQVFVSLCRRIILGDSISSNSFLSDNKQLFSVKRRILNSRMATDAGAHSGRNRLAFERSPYLLQHASNPVEWFPWCEEAFEKAKNENKLIFLSVGYSTCHWCHVMERESFENEEVAEVMNKYFVNIKVDREERPDLDKIYMTFVQATAGGGGWPMSVWLTPELTPIYGGTYYPPTDCYGRPGFKSLLEIINKQWQENRAKFLSNGAEIIKVLKNTSVLDQASSAATPSLDCLRGCMHQLSDSYEGVFGGFGRAPKFPQPTILNFLLHVYARAPESDEGKQALNMCTHTLKYMARGGINDHVSQGFARYSTDVEWHVPHFEKMLYDQGQLAVAYAAAYQATKLPLFARTTKEILDYVSRDLSHPLGGFYSAEDADSFPTAEATSKQEGAFCVWTYDELQELLQEPIEGSEHKLADIISHHYTVKKEGNVERSKDPHGELRGKNVLIVLGSVRMTAEKFGLDVEKVRQCLDQARQILFEARLKRPRPHLDDKMITAWNGLMISGFAKGGQALDKEEYIERAIMAADFIKTHLYDPETHVLTRSCYRSSAGGVAQISVPISGFLDDYAFVIRGLLDLYESCFDPAYLEWAEQLQDKQNELFWNEENAGYYTSSASDVRVIVRLVEDQDGAEPSGNSVSALNLLRISSLLDRADLNDRATKLLASFSTRLKKMPLALTEMMCALLLHADSPTQIFVTGKRTDPGTKALLDVINSRLIGGRVLALADEQMDSILYKKCEVRKCEVIRRMKPINGQAAAFVCRHHTCSLPVCDAEALAKLLDSTDSRQ